MKARYIHLQKKNKFQNLLINNYLSMFVKLRLFYLYSHMINTNDNNNNNKLFLLFVT